MAWTEDTIRDALRKFLKKRDRWPRRVEFEEAGLMPLLRAVYRQGGAELWAQRMGVAYPPERIRADADGFAVRPDASTGTGKLTKIRLERGIAQGQLARLACISVSTLRRLENGHAKNVRLQVLVNLAAVLGVSLAEIVEEEWLDPEPRKRDWNPPLGRVPLAPDPPAASALDDVFAA